MDLCLAGNSDGTVVGSISQKIRLTRKGFRDIVTLSEVFLWEKLQVNRSGLL